MKHAFRQFIYSALIATTGIGYAPSPARADLEATLQNMLGQNVQVNSAGDVTTARRGGFYGGSVYIRGRVMSVDVINFTPPSFAAGCGGIDIFGGSFSMINAEQFVALLRAIAQNAAGYAFQLALKNICEQCATIVSGLQTAIQAMNEFTGNSCQMAQGVVNGGAKALGLLDTKDMQGTTIQQGFADAFEGFWGSLKDTMSNLTAAGPGGSNTYEDKYVVNVVWNAMTKGAVGGWFPVGGDNDLLEAIMSMTGTIIVTGPVDDENGEPSRKVTPIPGGTTITVNDLMYGNGSASYLNCNNTKCTDISTATQKLVGIVEMLEDLYIGDGEADPSSMLFQIAHGTPSAETAATSLVSQLGPIGSQIIQIAKTAPPGSGTAYYLFNQYKEWIAYELVAKFVGEAFAGIDQAVGGVRVDTAYADDWRANTLPGTIERVNDDLEKMRVKIAGPPESQAFFMQLHQYQVVNVNPFNR